MLQLIERIYDAATEPERWNEFASSYAKTIGGGATALVIEFPSANDPGVIFQHGYDPAFVESYANYYWQLEPTRDAPSKLRSQSVTPTPFAASEMERTEFYTDWMKPQGLLPGNAFVGVVENVCDGFTTIGNYRRNGAPEYGTEQLALTELLLPHLARGYALTRRLRAFENTQGSILEALDHLSFGVFLVDASLRVVRLNRAAERLLHARDGLTLRQRELGAAVSISRPSGARALNALVTPLRGDASRLGDPRIVAAVFVSDPASTVIGAAELFRSYYRLTRSEAAVAEGVAQGLSATEIAEKLTLGIQTVRSYLKQLFRKTNTKRQAELALLLARILVVTRD